MGHGVKFRGPTASALPDYPAFGSSSYAYWTPRSARCGA
jgi:hypothetical protein